MAVAVAVSAVAVGGGLTFVAARATSDVAAGEATTVQTALDAAVSTPSDPSGAAAPSDKHSEAHDSLPSSSQSLPSALEPAVPTRASNLTQTPAARAASTEAGVRGALDAGGSSRGKLRVLGALPEAGSGQFRVATGSTPQTGSGALVTYQVEVEREVPFDRAKIAGFVDRTLSDVRGWTASGRHGLARVESDGQIRVLLATPRTTDALCAPLDTGGRLSCRNGDLVVLNAWRWIHGADPYADDLRNYRRYLVNHEVGHALGNPHEDCESPGAIAPVMMQQTKGVADCVPNPWPSPAAGRR